MCQKTNLPVHERSFSLRNRPTFEAAAISIRGAFLVILALVFFAVSSTGAFAQDTTGTILGNVTDPSGASVANADVTVTNTATNIARTLKTTESGAFTVPNLDPGTYTVNIKMTGFEQTIVSNIQLSAGDRHRTDAGLVVGGASETVEITTTAPILQTDTSSIGSNVTERAVQDLPLNGRNFINLAQIIPGATEGAPNSISSGTRPDDRRPTSSVSINGQSEVLNDQLVDGLDNNERVIGTIGVRPAIDSIQEVRILTNSFAADGGRAGGALINVITKSGTNSFHGTLYEFFRNDRLNAYAFQYGAGRAKPRLRQNQYGGSLGGPIFKDKAFFYGDAEFFRQIRGSIPSQLTVPTLYQEQNPGDFLPEHSNRDECANRWCHEKRLRFGRRDGCRSYPKSDHRLRVRSRPNPRHGGERLRRRFSISPYTGSGQQNPNRLYRPDRPLTTSSFTQRRM